MNMDLALATSRRMFSEAAEASAVIARQRAENASLYREIGRTLRTLSPQVVLTFGRGSSDHAATYGKYLVETRTGDRDWPGHHPSGSVCLGGDRRR